MATFTNTPAYAWSDGDLVTAARLALTATPTTAAGQSYSFADGTAAAPSISFNSDVDNGFYFVGANSFGVTCGGSSIGFYTTAGLQGMAIGSASPSTGAFTTLSSKVSTGTNPVLVGVLSNATTYGAISFNTSLDSAAGIVIEGGGGVDTNLYFNVPTGGIIKGSVNAVNIFSFSASGLAVVSGFGCNGKTPQTAFASGGVLAQVVAALINCGILSS